MTDHLSKQDGRGADSWTLKQWLFALVFCCVPLDVLFWIARLISVPFSLFCHWQVSSCTPPAKASLPSHLLPFLSPLIKVKRGRCQRLLEIHPLGNILPVCRVIKTKPPFCPSWQVREIISGGNYNWRERGCSDQWYREGEREGGSSTSTLWSGTDPPCPFSPAMSSPTDKLRPKMLEHSEGRTMCSAFTQFLLFSLLTFRTHPCIREGLVAWLI